MSDDGHAMMEERDIPHKRDVRVNPFSNMSLEPARREAYWWSALSGRDDAHIDAPDNLVGRANSRPRLVHIDTCELRRHQKLF